MTCCAGKLLRGGVALVRAAIGRDRASNATMLARQAACLACPQIRGAWPLAQCRLCGCLVAAKRRLASETCPTGRWPSPPATTHDREDLAGRQ